MNCNTQDFYFPSSMFLRSNWVAEMMQGSQISTRNTFLVTRQNTVNIAAFLESKKHP